MFETISRPNLLSTFAITAGERGPDCLNTPQSYPDRPTGANLSEKFKLLPLIRILALRRVEMIGEPKERPSMRGLPGRRANKTR